LINTIRSSGLSVENSKYFWLNIYGSRHGTAEFRIFHAVESMDEIKNFITMAHNIVELAKKSTPEQLEFIILSLYESENIYRLRENFLQLLGMEGHEVPFKGGQARQYMETKLAEKQGKRKPLQNERYIASAAAGSRVVGERRPSSATTTFLEMSAEDRLFELMSRNIRRNGRV
jgi:hypothetical protein